MPDSTLSQALKEAYAEAPDDPIIHTLELRHSAFIDDLGQPTAVRVCIAQEPFNAFLEATAPLDPSTEVTFIPLNFQFSEPAVDDQGVGTFKVSLDNVGLEIVTQIERAIQVDESIKMTYRPYMESDPSGPEIDPPFHMELRDIKVTPFRVTGVGATRNLNNVPFPRELYTREAFPSLAR